MGDHRIVTPDDNVLFGNVMASPLDRWCKGKPPLVGRVAKEFAWTFFHLVSGAFEISCGNRDSRFDQNFKPEAWLDFYHNPERLPKWYFDTGAGLGTWEKLKTWTADEVDTADDLLLQLDELCDIPDSDNDNEPLEQMVSIEVDFIARVFIPSILVYRQTPWRLFELATKNEDYFALEQLLRIDRLIVFDPTIQRFWIDAFRGTNEALRKHFLRALKKDRRFSESELKSKKVKIFYAAFVNLVAQLSGHKLTISNLLDLVNAASKDFSGGSHELDFYVDEDAFRKALKRGEKELKVFLSTSIGAD